MEDLEDMSNQTIVRNNDSNAHARMPESNGDEQADSNQSDSHAPITNATVAAAPDDEDEVAKLANLGADIRDQDDLERDIGRQADQMLQEQADERDQKRLDKTQREKDMLAGQIRVLEQKLTEFGNHTTKNKYRSEIQHYNAKIAALDEDLRQIKRRMDERQQQGSIEGDAASEDASNKRMAGESQRDFLIRTGKITPFSKMGRQLLKASSSLGEVLLDAEGGEETSEDDNPPAEGEHLDPGPMSHRNLLAPGFDQDDSPMTSATENVDKDAELARKLQDEEFASERPAKRRRLQRKPKTETRRERSSTPADDSGDFMPSPGSTGQKGNHESEDDEEDEAALATTPGMKRTGRARKMAKQAAHDARVEQEDLAGIDDGNENVYQARLQSWVKRRSAARRRFKEGEGLGGAEGLGAQSEVEAHPDEMLEALQNGLHGEEWHTAHPNRTDTEFEGGFRIPGDIYPSLFDYQKTGVQWLWELYSQQVGGIVGDEMGLGKTIQVISFLAGLHYSKKLTKPVIIVCPATVMKQWVNEFHRWWPPLRVSILHTSGSGMLDVRREERIEDDLDDTSYVRRSTVSKGQKSAKKVLDRVVRDGHVLVTTYSGLQTYAELLIPTDWEYAVLDEGHKIRNPNTAITVFCKELRTHNRVILSGTPMQNNLTELWSLFDFIFPMRLGTLVNFRNQFEIPIKQGGYANASNLQVETAMQCAETLKDAISPYLLQRFKADVAADLPKKSERVLFCRLTKLQQETYQWFLASEEMRSILAGKRQALYGIDILRKICNHPDLVEHKTLSKKEGYVYGSGGKSGKMQVVKALLEIWKRAGHKTLLFAQHRIMLDILEIFVGSIEGINFRRMDGNTAIKDRQTLVDEFNNDPDIHVFLLTTKVGGLGVNLTGADRVIIYDPDWNPSTDVQARERAWRLGQKREVEIYRLMTAGTIEEKIYHRQIFKQFLTNKILRDPKQRQTFQLKDLHDLFTLGDTQDGQTETGSIFQGTEVQLSGSKGKEKQESGSEDVNGDSKNSNEHPPNLNTITGVSRQEDYEPGATEADPPSNPTDQDSNTSSLNKDDRVLSSIFARTGVHAAHEHDAIINGRRSAPRADPAIIAREARRVADQAARELQRASVMARTLPAGVPTWTGQVGTAGRPDEPSLPRRGGMGRGGARGGGRGGPSSAAVMANLQARQAGSVATSSSSETSVRRRGEQAPQPEGKEFLVLIRDFLLAQGGKAYTQMLIDHFNRYCGTGKRTAEFKEMLRTIATLEKGFGGRGKWVLKEEYRT